MVVSPTHKDYAKSLLKSNYSGVLQSKTPNSKKQHPVMLFFKTEADTI